MVSVGVSPARGSAEATGSRAGHPLCVWWAGQSPQAEGVHRTLLTQRTEGLGWREHQGGLRAAPWGRALTALAVRLDYVPLSFAWTTVN